MVKIKYNKNLDSINEVEKMAEFYDKADLNDYFNTNSSSRTKKINLSISISSSNLAGKISNISGLKYNDTLKLAVTLGLVKLLDDLKSQSKK